MKVTILGAGTAVPDQHHTQSGYLLEYADGNRILFDCGAGKMLRLAQAGVDFWKLDRLMITHTHLDHIGDIPSLIFGKGNPTLSGNSPLTIYGPSQFESEYQAMSEGFGSLMRPKGYDLNILPFPIETGLEENGREITAHILNHRRENYGYRVEAEGKIFAYSGDTDECEAAIELGRGADVYILECALPEEHYLEGHLTPTTAGKIAAAAGCKHLVLTHLYPQAIALGDELKKRTAAHFSGEITIARDLMTLEI